MLSDKSLHLTTLFGVLIVWRICFEEISPDVRLRVALLRPCLI
jgi:hypothetical protein